MNILVVEDDVLIAEHLKAIIEEDELDTVTVCFSKSEAIEHLLSCDFHLVILDINMENPDDGIQLAEEINNKFFLPFIYVTAQSDRVMMDRAVSTQPIAYVVKPYTSVAVLAAVNISRNQQVMNELVVRDGYKEVVIPMKDIVYGKANNNYVEIFGLKKKWLIRITLANLMESLPSSIFIQVHRSYFVNKGQVESIAPGKILVKGEFLPVSKGFEDMVKSQWQSSTY